MAFTNVASEQELDQLLSSKKVTIAHFWAPWAAPCAGVDAILAKLAEGVSAEQTAFAKIEAEEVTPLAEKYGIIAVPTVIAFQGATEFGRLEGANAADLGKLVDTVCKKAGLSAPSSSSSSAADDLNKRLASLVSSAPVMVFMKGVPEAPRCGFSSQIVALLQRNKVEFGSFDILSDETVRNGLKAYSNWPTYPQLYAYGKLVGGLDIVKELEAEGELTDALAPPS